MAMRLLAAPILLAASAGIGQASLLDGAAKSLVQSAEQGVVPNSVLVEVYYRATCSHCLDFFQHGILPLLWAKLPSERVFVRLMPWVPGNMDADACISDLNCFYARDHMCGMKSTFQQPVGVSSPELASVAQFAFCNLFNAVHSYQPQVVAAQLQNCSGRANLPWQGSDGVQACSDSGAGYSFLASEAYRAPVAKAKELLDQLPGHMAPFVFIDGQHLSCESPTWCSALTDATHEEKLELPGTLLRVVCSRLFPVPPECDAILVHDPDAKPAAPATRMSEGACETCDEVGHYHWDEHRTTVRGVPVVSVMGVLLAAAAGASLLGGAVMLQRATRRGRNEPQGRMLLAGLEEGSVEEQDEQVVE